jgi:hypothetical protein
MEYRQYRVFSLILVPNTFGTPRLLSLYYSILQSTISKRIRSNTLSCLLYLYFINIEHAFYC